MSLGRWLENCGRMLLKRQMQMLRERMFKKRIEYLQAQIDLAKHNMQQFEKRIRDQQALITQAPFTRKNLQKRRVFGDRQNEGRYVLDEKEQEELKQALILKRARMEEIADKIYEEDIILRNLQINFSDTFQFRTLTETLNNELARRERINSGG